MPCSCGQKVERAQPKVQCAKCNELFHTQCVGILPADLEFLMSSDRSFFCTVCAAARRKSIRSPPSPPMNAISTNETNSNVQSNSSNSLSINSIGSLNQSDNYSESTNKQEVTLESLNSILVSLRSENAHVHKVISDIREDNNKLLNKTENLHSDLLSMQRNLLEKDNMISLLTTEVNNLRSYIAVAFEKFGSDNAAAKEVTAAKCTRPPLSLISHAALSSPIATKDLPSSSNAWPSAVSHSHVEISAPTVVVSSAALSPTTAALSPTTAANADVGVNVTAAIRSNQSAHTYAKVSAPVDAVSNAALLSTSCSVLSPAAAVNNAQWTTVNNKRSKKHVKISGPVAAEPNISRSVHSPAATVNNAQWTTVNKKRSKKQVRVVGTNNCNELDVAVKYKWLHLASFSPSVSEDDIKDYVSKHTGLSTNIISCFKLIKKDASLTSIKRVNFKLGVPEPSYEKLLSSEIWPTNVTVKQFRFFPKDSQQPPPA